jgi:hypothetical protein
MAPSAENGAARRARLAAAWLISAAIIAGYYLMPGDELPAAHPAAAAAPRPGDADKLDITDIEPTQPTPGSALAVRFVDTAISETVGGPPRSPLRALLSGDRSDHETRAIDLEVLDRRGGEVVVRIPRDARPGRHKLRLERAPVAAAGPPSGDPTRPPSAGQPGIRSKPYDIQVDPIRRRQIFRTVLGGLALLVFGLRTLSEGTRGYTGQREEGLLALVARRRSTAAGVGLLMGLGAQLTTTAAGLMVGLVDSHLLGATAGAAALLGAQLGAAAAPTLLGLSSTTREGLLLVAGGVLWLTLAADRRGQALGKLILGCGLLLYGIHLLRLGLQPLVSDPEIVAYVDWFHAGTLGGRLACVAAGALLAALLQGPAPVFPVVLELVRASGRIDLASALAILAGTGLGSSLGTLLVAWPFGAEPRRMARLYFLAALLGTVALAATVDLWAFLATHLAGAAGPGRELAVGFALCQLAAVAPAIALLPVLLRTAGRFSTEEAPRQLTGSAGLKALSDGLARVLAFHRTALTSILDLGVSGDRTRGVDGEHALADARTELEALFAGAMHARAEDRELGRLRQAALGALQLQRAMEELLEHAERNAERVVASTAGGSGQPAPADARDAHTFRALHTLLLEGLDAVVGPLTREHAPDVDAARAREIRLNALEGETRQAVLAQAGGLPGQDASALAQRLVSTDLVSAYESVGNQLYRLHEALASEVDQDAAE